MIHVNITQKTFFLLFVLFTLFSVFDTSFCMKEIISSDKKWKVVIENQKRKATVINTQNKKILKKYEFAESQPHSDDNLVIFSPNGKYVVFKGRNPHKRLTYQGILIVLDLENNTEFRPGQP